MDFINSFPRSDLIAIAFCILILVALFCYNRLRNSFHQKIKKWSPDIIVYDVNPEISIVQWPIAMEQKHLVSPYYIWELKFEDQWWTTRSTQFKLLEQHLSQDIIDQIEINKKDGNWADDIWLESSESKSKRFKLIENRIIERIDHTIQVKQDSTRKRMFQLDNPLRGQQIGDHNNAQETRNKKFINWSTSVYGILIIVVFPIILVLAAKYWYIEKIISYLHLY